MSKLTGMMISLAVASASVAWAGSWTEAVEVRHDENLCVSYQARLDGPYLVVRAMVEPGWHTFAMDNKQRAEKKLAGKQSLGIDHPTEIVLGEGLEAVGPWYQSPPKDFSRPELRWYSWGFEGQAVFVSKVRRSGKGPARLTIRGQACTETTCKNIDAAMAFPLANTDANQSDVNLKNLVKVR